MNINKSICELFRKSFIKDDNSIVFTSQSVELIHEIAENCNTIPIVKETQEQAKKYAKDLTAEQIYVYMLYKIAAAPTSIHMEMTAKMLIPVISKKLKERGM